MTATGASRGQTLLYAIVPQVRPVFTGVCIYRWDINIRESTVLGLVGAGGLGFALNEAILGLEWSRVGLILLIVLALPVAYLAALNTTFNRATYALARLVMVVSRSVDTLVWALMFIVVVGPGSLAGLLAVAVRSIGFVSKLLAEGIEETDRGQVEAIVATGADRWRVLLYAIVPQVRPVFAGVCVYRWDINIRESTVLGLVGAGGIGFALNEAILGLEWSRVGLILVVILGVVALSETASAVVRRRLT